MKSPADIVVGLDEAGRGCLAGPVVAAAAWLDPVRVPPELLAHIDDSKKLAEARREEVAAKLRALPPEVFACTFASIEAAEIDSINILRASLKAMEFAYRALVMHLPRKPTAALVDGNKAPAIPDAMTVIKGDSKSLSIAAASIIAKVEKDRALSAIGLKYPGYDFDRNKGYPTAEHLEALKRLGPCPEHRHTYAPVANLVK
jgi:ribonuclease HII